MIQVDAKEIKRLLDTIHTCEVAVQRLKHNPPLTLCFNEVTAYTADFSKMGAKALVEYYRLTKELFNDQDSSDEQKAG